MVHVEGGASNLLFAVLLWGRDVVCSYARSFCPTRTSSPESRFRRATASRVRPLHHAEIVFVSRLILDIFVSSHVSLILPTHVYSYSIRNP